VVTKQQWEEIEKELQNPWGSVSLLCDGYELTLQVQRDKMRLVIIPYIGGHFKGVWIGTDCEERRRFMRVVKRKKWGGNTLKGFTKKELKSMRIDPNETSDSFTPIWTAFKPLKAHLIKNNTSIELAPEV
jgi:hypothetical protein